MRLAFEQLLLIRDPADLLQQQRTKLFGIHTPSRPCFTPAPCRYTAIIAVLIDAYLHWRSDHGDMLSDAIASSRCAMSRDGRGRGVENVRSRKEIFSLLEFIANRSLHRTAFPYFNVDIAYRWPTLMILWFSDCLFTLFCDNVHGFVFKIKCDGDHHNIETFLLVKFEMNVRVWKWTHERF